MHNLNVRPVPNLISGILDSTAQIDLLIVKEEPFVKISNSIECFLTYDAEGTRHPIDWRRFAGVGPRTVGPSQHMRTWIVCRQAGHHEQIVEERWKHPSRGLPRVVASDQARASYPGRCIIFHVNHRQCQCTGREEGVRIKQHDIAAARDFKSTIVGTSES